MRKIVSGIMLTLLLISMLTLTFNVQFGKTDTGSSRDSNLDTEVCSNDEIQIGKARIREHKVTGSDIEKLKSLIGTWEKGKNYTQIIDGHGTGLRPPTEEEWTQMIGNGRIVEKISLDETIQTPSLVDHTTKPWFPPVGDQGTEGSCTCWAVGYYMKTFQEAKEHDWHLSGTAWEKIQDKVISPDFIYHLINDGVDGGSSPYTAINLICSIGASSWEKMPYNPDDHATWPSEEAWREAPLYRGNSSGYDWMWITTDEGLASLKNWIVLDNLAEISVDANKIWNGLWSLLTSKDMLTLDNYAPPISTNHAVTIVGYDDNFEYTEQGQTRFGAFKIANSWGIGSLLRPWEHIYDGCFWVSYEAMKQHIRYCEFYNDRIGYEPELAASFRITHSKRGECSITVGVGSQTKSFSDYILGGDQPFPSNNIIFDITEFKDTIPNIYGQQFFLEVYDGGSSTTGTINKFAVEYAESENPPISTINGFSVYAYVTLSPLETNWRIGKQVNSDNDFLDNKVSMATDSNGYLYAAYDDWYPAGSVYAIFVKRSTDGGETWSDFKNLYRYKSCHNPAITIDPYDNRIFVAYEFEYSSSDYDIYCWVYAPGIIDSHIAVDTDSGNDRSPSITSEYQYGSANWQYISYEYIYSYNDRDLMFAKSTNHGATWSVKKLRGDFPDWDVRTHTCITNAEGTLYLAYRWGADYGSICTICVDYSADFGNSWASVADIDGLPNDCSFPSVAATHGGSTVVIAFQYAYSASDINVCYSYSTNKGVSWHKGYGLFGSSLEDEKSPVLAVDGGGSTGNDVRGYFHIACKVGSYVKYRKAHYGTPYSWSSPVIVSERWVGKSIALATQYRNSTAEFHPYVSWNNEQTNNIYCSTVGHVHNLNSGLRYESIQEAINANETARNHTLLAESRTYNEIVLLNKSVTLLGEGWADTTIYGKGYNYVVEVSANDSVIEGFAVENGYFGIGIHSCSNVTIQSNLVTDNEIGIFLWYGSSSSKILQNNVTLNRHGIWISDSCDNLLRNNSMTANKYNFGVGGDNLKEFIHDIDISNTVNGKPIQYWINERNKTVPINAGYVALVNCTQITMQNLDLANNGEGLLLAYTTNSNITENTIANNECGIGFHNSSSVTTFKNNLSSNGAGINLFKSLNNRIIQNNLTANYWSVYLLFSSNNTIAGNDIEANKDVGIYFWNSSDNSFYHNNFVNNTHQIYDGHWDHPEQCLPSINFWDNGFPSGGNYWSDYNGTDLNTGLDQNVTGSDGIGDTPYTIDENNTDKYPLMRLWTSPDIAVLNVTPSNLTVRQGFLIHINITAMNQGNKIEGFNLTAYANTTSLQTQYFTLVSNNSTTFTYAWNTSGFLEGHYTISAYASPVEGETDTADNLKVDGAVKIDITPPTIVILSPQNKTYYSDSIPLTFIIDEPTSWIGYSLDNQPNITISGNTVINVENGLHQIVVYANDTAGNMGSSYSVYFAVNSSFYDPWKTSFIGLGGYPIVDFAVYNGNLYAAADNTLYMYDGSSWNIITVPTYVISLESYEGKLIVGGKGGLYSYDGTTFSLIFTVPTYVKSLGIYNNTLYAGTLLASSPTLYYCNGSATNPDNWHVDTGFASLNPGSGIIPGFCTISRYGEFDGKLYLTTGKNAFSYDGVSWKIVTEDDNFFMYDLLTDDSIGSINSVKEYNSKYYAITIDSPHRCPVYEGKSGFSGRVFEYNGTSWNVILDNNYWIFSLEVYDGKLYAGTANKIYVFNGTGWSISFDAGQEGYYALAMIVYDNKIYVGMGNGYIFADPAPPKTNTEATTVPEFPSATILAVFMVLTMFAAALIKKKWTRRFS